MKKSCEKEIFSLAVHPSIRTERASWGIVIGLVLSLLFSWGVVFLSSSWLYADMGVVTGEYRTLKQKRPKTVQIPSRAEMKSYLKSQKLGERNDKDLARKGTQRKE